MSEELETSDFAVVRTETQKAPVRSEPNTNGDAENLTRQRVISWVAVVGVAIIGTTIVGLTLDWNFSEWVGVISLVISIFGFGIAILEIKRARSVAIATQVAVGTALARVETTRLHVAITEMQGLAATIEDACEQGDMRSFRDSSRRWRSLAGSAIALIGQRSNDENQVVELLEDARRLGREANLAIHEQQGVTLRETARDFLAAIVEVADSLTLLAEELLTTIEPLDEH